MLKRLARSFFIFAYNAELREMCERLNIGLDPRNPIKHAETVGAVNALDDLGLPTAHRVVVNRWPRGVFGSVHD